MTLLVGSLCVLKSGSPIMIVKSVEQESPSKNTALREVGCVWFDGGDLHQGTVPLACLQEVHIG